MSKSRSKRQIEFDEETKAIEDDLNQQKERSKGAICAKRCRTNKKKMDMYRRQKI